MNYKEQYLEETIKDAATELIKIYFKEKSMKGKIIMTKSELAAFTLEVINLIKKIYL